MRALGVALSFGTSHAHIDSVRFSLHRFAMDADNSDATVPELLEQLAAKSLALGVSRTELIHRQVVEVRKVLETWRALNTVSAAD